MNGTLDRIRCRDINLSDLSADGSSLGSVDDSLQVVFLRGLAFRHYPKFGKIRLPQIATGEPWRRKINTYDFFGLFNTGLDPWNTFLIVNIVKNLGAGLVFLDDLERCSEVEFSLAYSRAEAPGHRARHLAQFIVRNMIALYTKLDNKNHMR